MEPSNILAKSKTESEGQKQTREMQDLKSKTDAQLKELLERQDHILNQKGLVAKLADKGERVRSLKTRIEQELASREQMHSLGGKLTEVKLGENMEWNLAADWSEVAPKDSSADPLLSYLQSRNENVEPYVENICTKFASTKQGDDAPDRFLPHRSNEAPIRGGKSPGGKSPRQEAAEGHSIQEIPIKDSLILQRNQAQATVPKSGSQLSSWRQMASTIDSEESEDEMDAEKVEAEVAAEMENEQDPPEVPDF